MDSWEIKPKSSVGPLKLGMSMADAVSTLGDEFSVFRRTPISKEDILAFDSEGVHLTLSEDEEVVEIATFRPRNVFLDGIQLLGVEMDDLKRQLEEKAIAVERSDAGLLCPALGLVLVEVDGEIDGVEVR